MSRQGGTEDAFRLADIFGVLDIDVPMFAWNWGIRQPRGTRLQIRSVLYLDFSNYMPNHAAWVDMDKSVPLNWVVVTHCDTKELRASKITNHDYRATSSLPIKIVWYQSPCVRI